MTDIGCSLKRKSVSVGKRDQDTGHYWTKSLGEHWLPHDLSILHEKLKVSALISPIPDSKQILHGVSMQGSCPPAVEVTHQEILGMFVQLPGWRKIPQVQTLRGWGRLREKEKRNPFCLFAAS